MQLIFRPIEISVEIVCLSLGFTPGWSAQIGPNCSTIFGAEYLSTTDAGADLGGFAARY